jgi:hypothetical protein
MRSTTLRTLFARGRTRARHLGRSLPARLSGLALVGWIAVTTGGGFPR